MQIQKYEKRTRNNVSESTLNSRKSALKNLQRFIDEEREVTVNDVENWVDHLLDQYEKNEVSAGTIQQYFKSVRYYFNTVLRGDDELEHIKDWIPTGDTDHGDYLTEDELVHLLDTIYNYRDKCILTLMYEYGRRPSEVLKLNVEDVDLEEGTITFPILKKQEDMRATFEITDEARKVLEDHLKYHAGDPIEAEESWEEGEVVPLFNGNGRLSYDSVWRFCKKYAENAGFEDKNIIPKIMRHSRATHLDWAGHNPQEIARHQLVHGPNSNVISAYIHDRDEDQTREVMTPDNPRDNKGDSDA